MMENMFIYAKRKKKIAYQIVTDYRSIRFSRKKEKNKILDHFEWFFGKYLPSVGGVSVVVLSDSGVVVVDDLSSSALFWLLTGTFGVVFGLGTNRWALVSK